MFCKSLKPCQVVSKPKNWWFPVQYCEGCKTAFSSCCTSLVCCFLKELKWTLCWDGTTLTNSFFAINFLRKVAWRAVFKFCVHRWSQELCVLILLLPHYCLSINCCFASQSIMLNGDLSPESAFCVALGMDGSAWVQPQNYRVNKIPQILSPFVSS